MRISTLLFTVGIAFKAINGKAIKPKYDNFNYSLHCSGNVTLCNSIQNELTNAVNYISSLMELKPKVNFEAIVDDMSKYRVDTSKEVLALGFDKNFKPYDTSSSNIITPYPGSTELITKLPSFENDDFVLVLNNFNSNKEGLANSNLDYQNNSIKEILTSLSSQNRLSAPYNKSGNGGPPGGPPPGGPPPGGMPGGGMPGGGMPGSGEGGDFFVSMPESSIYDILSRNQNVTALYENSKINDQSCSDSQLNKLNTIIQWKNRLISRGNPSETNHFKHKRIVAIGDIHGDCTKLKEILVHAEVINKREQWIAYDTLLVQTGDLIDRGGHIKDILELLIKLRREAKKKRSDVHLLFGNHEILNFRGNYQFTSHSDLKSWKSLEFREHQFSIEGKYGKWMRTDLNITMVVGNSLFAHAGLTPKFAQMGIDNINRQAREILVNAPSFAELYQMGLKNQTHPLYNDPILSDGGPLWIRDYSMKDESSICPEIETTLQMVNAKRMIIGHTVQNYGEIHSRCNGKLILIDIGLSYCYGSYFGYVEIKNDVNEVWAVYKN